MPGAEIRGRDRSWRCLVADFENEGSTACKSASHHSLSHVSLLPWNFKHGEVSTPKNKNPCRCEQLPCLLPSLQAPHSSVGGHMASLGIALEEKPNFAFEWLHWVINSALAFDPKEIGCNSVMFRVELQRSGVGRFLPQNGSPPGSLQQRPLQPLLQLFVSAWSSAPLGRQDQAA